MITQPYKELLYAVGVVVMFLLSSMWINTDLSFLQLFWCYMLLDVLVIYTWPEYYREYLDHATKIAKHKQIGIIYTLTAFLLLNFCLTITAYLAWRIWSYLPVTETTAYIFSILTASWLGQTADA